VVSLRIALSTTPSTPSNRACTARCFEPLSPTPPASISVLSCRRLGGNRPCPSDGAVGTDAVPWTGRSGTRSLRPRTSILEALLAFVRSVHDAYKRPLVFVVTPAASPQLFRTSTSTPHIRECPYATCTSLQRSLGLLSALLDHTPAMIADSITPVAFCATNHPCSNCSFCQKRQCQCTCRNWAGEQVAAFDRLECWLTTHRM
jgi:hypothetical protein